MNKDKIETSGPEMAKEKFKIGTIDKLCYSDAMFEGHLNGKNEDLILDVELAKYNSSSIEGFEKEQDMINSCQSQTKILQPNNTNPKQIMYGNTENPRDDNSKDDVNNEQKSKEATLKKKSVKSKTSVNYEFQYDEVSEYE